MIIRGGQTGVNKKNKKNFEDGIWWFFCVDGMGRKELRSGVRGEGLGKRTLRGHPHVKRGAKYDHWRGQWFEVRMEEAF
jgi:hypothetical protein